MKKNGEVTAVTSNTPCWLSASDEGVMLAVHVQPGAKRDAVVGEYNGRLKLSLNAPPVDGKANTKLTAFIAKKLGVSKSSVRLISGETQRTKRLSVSGITTQTAIAALTQTD